MAKLTESYLRGMIKQVINEMGDMDGMSDKSYLYDFQDEADSIGEKELADSVGHSDDIYETLEEIDNAISDLENGDMDSALFSLRDARKRLDRIAGTAGDAIETTANRGNSMRNTAYKTGMPSAESEFGTVRSMDEARKRKLAPKRR